MSINAWANDQGALFAVPMTSAMPPDPSDGSWVLQWDPILRQLKYAPFVPPAPEFDLPVPYVGGLAMTVQNQTVEYTGTVYAPVLGTLPFITSGIWATDSAKFRVIQGATTADLAASVATRLPLEGGALTGQVTAAALLPVADDSLALPSTSWVRAAMTNIAAAAGFAAGAGYFKLPAFLGGYIFQWKASLNTNNVGVGYSSATWPIAFPTTILMALASPRTAPSKAFELGHVNIESVSATSYAWVTYTAAGAPDSRLNQTETVFFAIGR